MKKFEGKYPANARVDIDYSKGKPKVRFSYPKNGDSGKVQALKQHSFGYHTIFLILISYILFAFLEGLPSTNLLEKDLEDYPTNCSVLFNEGYVSINLSVEGYEDFKKVNSSINSYKKFVKGMNVTCNTGIYELKFNKERNMLVREGFEDISKETKFRNYYSIYMLSILFSICLIGYLINKLITKQLLKSKKYAKWFPEAQANGVFFKTKKKKYICFEPKDVINNEVIIPIFSNVELDYKTEGDFDKYLVRIIIREHRYNKYHVKENKIGKELVNCYKWYARFIFSKKPVNGKMEVIFQ